MGSIRVLTAAIPAFLLPCPMQIDNTYNKLQTLCEYIDDTEVGGRVLHLHSRGVALRAWVAFRAQQHGSSTYGAFPNTTFKVFRTCPARFCVYWLPAGLY